MATAIANGGEASKAFVTRPMAGQGSRDSVINTFLLEDRSQVRELVSTPAGTLFVQFSWADNPAEDASTADGRIAIGIRNFGVRLR